MHKQVALQTLGYGNKKRICQLNGSYGTQYSGLPIPETQIPRPAVWEETNKIPHKPISHEFSRTSYVSDMENLDVLKTAFEPEMISIS